MTPEQINELTIVVDGIAAPLSRGDLPSAATALGNVEPDRLADVLERLDGRHRAVAYRLLPKGHALQVFEALSPNMQGELIGDLRDVEVAHIFGDLDPDDRAWLVDELPASLASRLMRGLPAHEREMTAAVLGYRRGSIGRRMSPEFVSVPISSTVAAALDRVRARLHDAETVYTLPVVDDGRRVAGVVSLRDLLAAEPGDAVREIMQAAQTAGVDDDAETAARRCTERGLLALPIVDSEERLVGILTVDDAARILEHEESEDAARQGGAEPLRRPYLSTPIGQIVRSRVVWLLVLAVGATLTVQVLSAFEDTLAQVTVLALFVPLLIGTGGNTGNQAATTVTRALALGDVRPRDIARVLSREVRVGFFLGSILGLVGFGATALVYEPRIGLVIGVTLVAVCTMAATVGGVMPLLARAIRVDPAVFSNPFITTFVDASGLILYFLIARAILQI